MCTANSGRREEAHIRQQEQWLQRPREEESGTAWAERGQVAPGQTGRGAGHCHREQLVWRPDSARLGVQVFGLGTDVSGGQCQI